jgi:hypothetical protein
MPDHGFAPPSDEPPPPVPPQPYPRAYADRPLLLPNGAVEGAVALRIDTLKTGSDRYTTGGLLPSLRVGLGLVELEAGAAIYLFQDTPADNGSGTSPDDPDRLQSLYAIGRVTVAPETAIAAQFIASMPTNDTVKTYVPGAFVEHKEHFAQVASLRATGGFNYVHPSYDDNSAPSQDSLDFYAKARVAVQVAPLVALEGATELHYVRFTGDMPYYDSYTSSLVSVGIVGNVAPDFDIVAAFESNSDQLGNSGFDGKAFTVGLVGRRIP